MLDLIRFFFSFPTSLLLRLKLSASKVCHPTTRRGGGRGVTFLNPPPHPTLSTTEGANKLRFGGTLSAALARPGVFGAKLD